MKGQSTPIGVILVLAALTQLVNLSHVEGIDQDFSNMLLEIATGNSTYPAIYTISQMQAGDWIVVNLTVPEEDYKLNVLSTAGSSYDSEYDPSILEISYMPGLSNDFSNLVIQFIDYNGNPEEISYTIVSKSDGNWVIIGLERPPRAGETISILAKVIELEDSEPESQPDPEPEPELQPEEEPEVGGTGVGPEEPLIEEEMGGELAIAGALLDSDLEILDKDGKKIGKKLTSELGNIKVVPKKGPLKKIIFKNLKSKNSFLRIDDVPENISAPEGVSWLSVYAIDPSALDFTSAAVTMVASGNSLYKCAAWDFDSRVCTDGNWKLIRTDLVPGQEYTLTITPDDPGFGEANLSVINVQSYPTVGGTWTVGFTTYGTADLRIRAVSGTTWSDSNDNEDLRLLNLMCGATPLSYTWESATNTAVYENYSCAQNGSETSRVLTPGKHYLEFRFGEDVDYAYNDACVNATDELFINNDTTLCSGTFNVNDAANDGLIKINASDLTLTCNNTVLDGDGTGYAIRVMGSQTNITVTGCNITDYDYGIDIQTDWDNGEISNNTFSEIDYYSVYLRAASSNITVDNNSFYQDSSSGNIMLYIYQSDYHTISNNYFQSTSDSGIRVYNIATYNNITNNTFNITYTGQPAIQIDTVPSNNNIWRNEFYGRGIELGTGLAGRTDGRITNNNYCVDGIGNAYFDLLSASGLERPISDCGPFPNISVISVNQSYDGNWEWNGTTSGTDVNFTSIQDALANAPHGALVNVTTSATETSGVAAYYLDNVTLECNNIGTIDNGLITGIGLDIRYIYNFTVQNCTVDQFDQSLLMSYVFNSSILNNTFANGNDESYIQYSDYNLIENNSFYNVIAGDEFLMLEYDSD
ncbi:right-handed parallel beta-helix repeat-containing protein, partial [Candidatus Micrarchaeota archaeon]|nr:right-handed parallel beta-helix repeat-containing protein [Candidatus Micrarchaeota archaeon]